jgi:hypothetical protein
MIILHAGALENRLFLWGEVAVEGEVPFPSRQGEKTGRAQPRPYPFDAGCTGLSSALKGTADSIGNRMDSYQGKEPYSFQFAGC